MEDRPTDGAAKLILPEFGLGQGKVVPCVEVVVADILVGRSVEFVGAGLGDHVDHGAGGATNVGRIDAGFNAEIFQRFS